jgi:S-methyl-5-thioribulose 1-phosphate isomerase
VSAGSDLVGILSGSRFCVTYLLQGDREEASRKARDICYEQTVEFPEDITPEGPIRDQIVGRVEELSPGGERAFRAVISYAVESAADDLTQFLNVVFGNISLKTGIRVERLDLPAPLMRAFPGPRFGRNGIRELLGVPVRPLICAALKPMGLSPRELADQAYRFALGGIDFIKDDHGLGNQPFSPFEERVARCCEAVQRATHETGTRTLYFPNVTTSAVRVLERARRAKTLGAGGLVISPGLAGMDALRLIASDDAIALPVMSHPSFLGSFVTDGANGFGHAALFGQLMRLAGADVSVFPNYGGRFGFTRQECAAIAGATCEPMGGFAPTFPGPGGGMTSDRAKDMLEVYGREFVLLSGGGMHRHSPDLAKNARHFVDMMSGF